MKKNLESLYPVETGCSWGMGNKAHLDSTEDSTHPELKGHWTDFLETLIPLIDGAKSLQLHLWLIKKGSDRLVW